MNTETPENNTAITNEVTLMQILQAREDRVLKQHTLLAAYHCPIISFTMNIAGPIKVSPLIERAFQEGLKALDEQLPKGHVLFQDTEISVTGCQAMYAVDLDALHLKKICADIEDATPLGRLFDMDVLDIDGTKLDRETVGGHPRNCIVCGAPGRVCAAGRLHTVPQLQAATRTIINDYFAIKDREQIASLAVQSLLDEVGTTPKPGLVDRRNNGSHRDMTLSTFHSSAKALEPYFQECVKIGQEAGHLSQEKGRLSPADTFLLLRRAGIAAESTMYEATGGVNTHKGIIYTFGVLCGSLGRLWTPECPIAETEAILTECARIVEQSVKTDFASMNSSRFPSPTAGQQLYQELGLTGIRGEVAAGLPSVIIISLPAYKEALQAGRSTNDAGSIALLHLIAHVKDTNLYHRGGIEGAAYAANAAKTLLEHTSRPSAQQIEALDDAFIARNLSPGGCADLLAVTYFLYRISLILTDKY